MSALSSRKGLLALLGLLVVVLAFRYWPGAPVAEPAVPRPSATGAGARKGGAPLPPRRSRPWPSTRNVARSEATS